MKSEIEKYIDLNNKKNELENEISKDLRHFPDELGCIIFLLAFSGFLFAFVTGTIDVAKFVGNVLLIIGFCLSIFNFIGEISGNLKNKKMNIIIMFIGFASGLTSALFVIYDKKLMLLIFIQMTTMTFDLCYFIAMFKAFKSFFLSFVKDEVEIKECKESVSMINKEIIVLKKNILDSSELSKDVLNNKKSSKHLECLSKEILTEENVFKILNKETKKEIEIETY
jgi:hypothetical protein